MSNIVEELENYLNNNPDLKNAFDLSVQIAVRMRIPQLQQQGIQDLATYIAFYKRFLTWVPTEDFDGRNVYYNLCVFYFILDLPPLKFFQTPILPTSPSKPPYVWLSDWVIRFAKVVGTFMDTPESITPESLQTFWDSPNYRMGDYLQPFNGWRTFNEFFSRELRAGLRPIDYPDDSTVIVSAADSVFDGSWRIQDQSVVYLKYIPWSIEQLLVDSPHKEKFSRGSFTHSFLGPYDYHRQHAPVSGRVIEARVIPGLCYLEVAATTDKDGTTRLEIQHGLPAARIGDVLRNDETERGVSAPNTPGYQFLQARGLIVIDNPEIGLVAALPIGMAQVSSVVLSVEAGQYVNKGDEISYFQMGGSDFVLVFQERANVQFSAVVDRHYNYGRQIAKAVISGK